MMEPPTPFSAINDSQFNPSDPMFGADTSAHDLHQYTASPATTALIESLEHQMNIFSGPVGATCTTSTDSVLLKEHIIGMLSFSSI